MAVIVSFSLLWVAIIIQGAFISCAHRRIDKLEERAKHLEESKDGIFFALSEIHKGGVK